MTVIILVTSVVHSENAGSAGVGKGQLVPALQLRQEKLQEKDYELRHSETNNGNHNSHRSVTLYQPPSTSTTLAATQQKTEEEEEEQGKVAERDWSSVEQPAAVTRARLLGGSGGLSK